MAADTEKALGCFSFASGPARLHFTLGEKTRMSAESTKKMRMDIASPADREKLVAELFFGSEQWAEIHQEYGQLMVQLYARRDGQPWEFPLHEAVGMLQRAGRRLAGDEP